MGTSPSPSGVSASPEPTWPAMMRAVVMREFGGPEVLTMADWPRPVPGPGEVLVRVRASFVAFGRDIEVRSARHPFFPRLITLPHILGGEHSGIVESVGAGVTADLVGIRVAVAATVACGRCAQCSAAASPFR